MSQRATSIMAIPPHIYDNPKGSFWKDTKELNRYSPKYPASDEVFEEYLGNKSMRQSQHVKTLAKSSGLMELHYNTMRQKQRQRSEAPCHVHGPTMTRTFTATSGYSGFIPGKISENVVGTTFTNASQIAGQTRSFYKPPMSGVQFHMTRTSSVPRLGSSPQGFSSSPPSGNGLPQLSGRDSPMGHSQSMPKMRGMRKSSGDEF